MREIMERTRIIEWLVERLDEREGECGLSPPQNQKTVIEVGFDRGCLTGIAHHSKDLDWSTLP